MAAEPEGGGCCPPPPELPELPVIIEIGKSCAGAALRGGVGIKAIVEIPFI